MTIDDEIRDEKLQYDINTEKLQNISLIIILNKCECLTGEEILPCNQKQIIEQATFTYSLLDKTFEKQSKTIEHQGKNKLML